MTNVYRSCRTGNDFVQKRHRFSAVAKACCAFLQGANFQPGFIPMQFEVWMSRHRPSALRLTNGHFVPYSTSSALFRVRFDNEVWGNQQLWKPGSSPAMSKAFRFSETFGSNPSGGSPEVRNPT